MPAEAGTAVFKLLVGNHNKQVRISILGSLLHKISTGDYSCQEHKCQSPPPYTSGVNRSGKASSSGKLPNQKKVGSMASHMYMYMLGTNLYPVAPHNRKGKVNRQFFDTQRWCPSPNLYSLLLLLSRSMVFFPAIYSRFLRVVIWTE